MNVRVGDSLVIQVMVVLTASLIVASPSGSSPGGSVAPARDLSCKALPPIQKPLAFPVGETLGYEITYSVVKAGKATFRVLPPFKGKVHLQANAKSNSFFNKIRRMQGEVDSYVDLETLFPSRVVEDADEEAIHHRTEVEFNSKDHVIEVNETRNERSGHVAHTYSNEGLDLLSLIYYLRQLPLQKMQTTGDVCLDVYGFGRMWHFVGKVTKRQHRSLAVGEFEAWQLSGYAIRWDDRNRQMELRIWISDDPQRLPLELHVGMNFKVVQATLTSFKRPGEKPKKAEGMQHLTW